MKNSDDIDFEADVSPSVYGKPIGFLEPTSPAVRMAQRARRRGDTCLPPEELSRVEGARHGHAALRAGYDEDSSPPTLL